MNWDVETLSRIQFAFTIMFHYIFPPFSIGVGLLLVFYESLYLITKKKIYEKITRFWIKIFAANFSVGVASGIVMEFEFGTNWSTYSRFVGDIFGSPLAAEGIFAFFLESGFLAILLFGWNRVKPGMHLFATIMVALGSILSGFWIVVANSWQQTPVAYEIVVDYGIRRAVITDFWEMVFNPSAMVRFTHVILGAWIQGAFLVMSVSAYYLIKKKNIEFAQKSFAIALGLAAIASLAQPFVGHSHAKIVAEWQPTKLAAFEGLYETQTNAPLYLIGWTDPETRETSGIAIPGMLSFLVHGDFDGEVIGLEEFPEEDWPAVNGVFQSYHLMVALGMLFIAVTLLSLFLLWRKQLFTPKWSWLIKFYIPAVALPVMANQLGWVSAERGRQPWIVQGLLRTSEGVSKSISAPEVMISLTLFVIVYILLFFIWLYVLDREIKHGPDHIATAEAGYKKKSERMDVIKPH
ncbi:cytochrome bd-I ubiquinol oxidase subunit 1 apoprotein [Algoriphagus faecimaris]|uniref:Cytochrome bd-I ubiquinol oxidase subunit 1 apoprotein n=1 Tax=Algoriphagus faecimaris TaxID=686796 RepID=A0A1G6MAH2_9BACT|nr:cytochrome ubiquinol oxidase subunit I [Algoriphagus faecimaris]SDC52337.1 cytochrome bd-I ubiquinol oxidase subunit 1 apoprotein [Algoriphagus faecimaris]